MGVHPRIGGVYRHETNCFGIKFSLSEATFPPSLVISWRLEGVASKDAVLNVVSPIVPYTVRPEGVVSKDAVLNVVSPIVSVLARLLWS